MEFIAPLSSEAACREVISQWSQLSELADFAERRHGYGSSDGGFGITYPGDLDEYDIEVEGIKIPNGSVLLYSYAFALPPGYELLVSEYHYLTVLAHVFLEKKLTMRGQ
ncbi:hypothetical protein [Pseudomonas sp. JZ134]|uniref:hypothetical protein n=1 Tax=Pseudomonas sp. JZ134 TaxID=2806615 RepID=UPI003DA0FF08